MTTDKAKQVVLFSMLATFGFGFINSFSKSNKKAQQAGGFPSPYHVRLFVGTGVVFIVLSATAEFAPDFAAPAAVLVGTTATVVGGADSINKLLSLVDPTYNPNTGRFK